jgi:hypothetical protein
MIELVQGRLLAVDLSRMASLAELRMSLPSVHVNNLMLYTQFVYMTAMHTAISATPSPLRRLFVTFEPPTSKRPHVWSPPDSDPVIQSNPLSKVDLFVEFCLVGYSPESLSAASKWIEWWFHWLPAEKRKVTMVRPSLVSRICLPSSLFVASRSVNSCCSSSTTSWRRYISLLD